MSLGSVIQRLIQGAAEHEAGTLEERRKARAYIETAVNQHDALTRVAEAAKRVVEDGKKNEWAMPGGFHQLEKALEDLKG